MTDSREAEILAKSAGKPKQGISRLWELSRFVKPYKWAIAGALVALVFAAGSTLGIGQAIRLLLDKGFSASSGALEPYFIWLMGVVAVLAIATFGRFYLVSWIGERVIADIRKAVFDHVLTLNPAFLKSPGPARCCRG